MKHQESSVAVYLSVHQIADFKQSSQALHSIKYGGF